MVRSRLLYLSHARFIFALLSFSAVLFVASGGAGQEATPERQASAKSNIKSAADDASLVQQLISLQSKVAKLETALKQNHQPLATTDQDAKKMSGMQGGSMPDMGRMDRNMMSGQTEMKPGTSSMRSGQTMGAMKMGGMGNMPMMGKRSGQGMSGMGGMGMMRGGGMSMMGQMQGIRQMPSALPGFAGASHIYHIGSTNFFFDHPQHIRLSQEQQSELNLIKQQMLLGQATFNRWIAEAEQELWMLTGADAPDTLKIEAKVRETEKLRGDKQIAFIRAVGDAVKVLTNEQRQTLVGNLPSDHNAAGVGN
jgi:hypothetical protein